MATPSKGKLLEQLRALNVEPPVNASSVELQALVKRVKALPVAFDDRPVPRAPAVPPPVAPPLAPPRPLASAMTPPRIGAASSGTPMSPPARPFVAVSPPPVPMSEHDARPWDPFAGY